MKKVFLSLLMVAALGSMMNKADAQMKVGVFDIDLMMQAMPGWSYVDSMTQIYQRDSLGAEYQIMTSEYHRLDSTMHADSLAKKASTVLDYENNQKQQIYYKLVNWQQYAQQMSSQKTQVIAQPLYEQVANAYKRFLTTHKYVMILKPQTYEQGFPIDNIFIGVAKELKMTSLPQELIYLGNDPDPAKPAAGTTPAKPSSAGAKPTKP